MAEEIKKSKVSHKNRKPKGKKFENIIAEKIHTFFHDNITNYKKMCEQMKYDPNLLPHRDSSSGNADNADGDINLGLLKPEFPYSIECKDHATMDFRMDSLFQNKIKDLYQIYEKQCKLKTDKNKLIPIIIFKSNRTKIYVFGDSQYLNMVEHLINQPKVLLLESNFFIADFDVFLDFNLKYRQLV